MLLCDLNFPLKYAIASGWVVYSIDVSLQVTCRWSNHEIRQTSAYYRKFEQNSRQIDYTMYIPPLTCRVSPVI